MTRIDCIFTADEKVLASWAVSQDFTAMFASLFRSRIISS